MGSLAAIGLAIAIVMPKPEPASPGSPGAIAPHSTAEKPKSKNTVRVENGVLKTTWPATRNESVRDVAQALASLSWDMSKNTGADVHSIEITLMFFARDGGMPTMGPLVADLRELRKAEGSSDVLRKPLADRFAMEIARSPLATELSTRP